MYVLSTYGATATLLAPDGTELAADTACGTECVLGPLTPDESGTYRIVYDPDDANIGALTAQLYEVPPDPTTALTVDGDPVTLETTVPGQNAVWSFDAVEGQELVINLFDGTLGTYSATARLIAPDGSEIDDTIGCGVRCFFDPIVMETTGTYQLVYDPHDAGIGTATAQIHEVAPDVTEALEIDGDPVTLETTVPAQNAIWTFDATAGQRIFVQLADGTLGTYDATVTLLAPDESEIDDDTGCGVECVFGPIDVEASGTYQIVFDPDDANTGALTAQVFEVIPDATATLEIDGDPVTLETTVPGQNAIWSFDGQAGQELQIELTDGTLGRYDAAVTVLAPDGSEVDDNTGCGTACTFGPLTLDETGAYQVVFDPDDANVGSLTAHLSQVATTSLLGRVQALLARWTE